MRAGYFFEQAQAGITDLADQAIEDAAGVKHGFSSKEFFTAFGMGALQGVAMGVNGVTFTGQSPSLMSWKSVVTQARVAAVHTILDSVINHGGRPQWREFVSSLTQQAIAVGVGKAMGIQPDNPDEFKVVTSRGLSSALSDVVDDTLYNEHYDWRSIAVNAAGSATGQMLGDGILRETQDKRQSPSMTTLKSQQAQLAARTRQLQQIIDDPFGFDDGGAEVGRDSIPTDSDWSRNFQNWRDPFEDDAGDIFAANHAHLPGAYTGNPHANADIPSRAAMQRNNVSSVARMQQQMRARQASGVQTGAASRASVASQGWFARKMHAVEGDFDRLDVSLKSRWELDKALMSGEGDFITRRGSGSLDALRPFAETELRNPLTKQTVALAMFHNGSDDDMDLGFQPVFAGDTAGFNSGLNPSSIWKSTQQWAMFREGDDDYSEEKDLPESVISEKRAGHIFRDDTPGHLPDSKINRQLIKDTANDKLAYLGSDRFGNHWYAKLTSDGGQIWAQVRDGEIINGGFNKMPREYNPQSGLSNPIKPKF